MDYYNELDLPLCLFERRAPFNSKNMSHNFRKKIESDTELFALTILDIFMNNIEMHINMYGGGGNKECWKIIKNPHIFLNKKYPVGSKKRKTKIHPRRYFEGFFNWETGNIDKTPWEKIGFIDAKINKILKKNQYISNWWVENITPNEFIGDDTKPVLIKLHISKKP